MPGTQFRLATPPRVLVPDCGGAAPQFVRLSPDGRSLAYAISGAGPKSSIRVDPVEGGARANWRLELDGGRLEELVWSPTGTRLAFLTSSGGPPGERHHAAWAEVGTSRGGSTPALSFAWDPWGAHLVVADPKGRSLRRVDTATGEETALCELADDGDPHFAPRIAAAEGTGDVAFTCRRAEQALTQIFVSRSEGPQRTVIVKASARSLVVSPFWSPGGADLGVHVVDMERSRSSVRVFAKGAPPSRTLCSTELVDTPGAGVWFGRWIAFTRTVTPSHEFTKSGPQRLSFVDAGSRECVTPDLPPVEGTLRRGGDATLVVDGRGSATIFEFEAPPGASFTGGRTGS